MDGNMNMLTAEFLCLARSQNLAISLNKGSGVDPSSENYLVDVANKNRFLTAADVIHAWFGSRLEARRYSGFHKRILGKN